MKRSGWCGLACVFVMAAVGACSKSNPTSPTTPVFTPNVLPPRPAGLTLAMDSMLDGLLPAISSALSANQALLPANPQASAQLNAKIAMLQSSTLGADIITGQRWVDGRVGGRRPTPICAVFPLESMRMDANDGVQVLVTSMPLLEDFYGDQYPSATLKLWYGFIVGNNGTSGLINSEDRASYFSRTSASALPYDAILSHEMSHAYMPNEALNQFLEMYLYNITHGASNDPLEWTHNRGWIPGAFSNVGSLAVLDVYQMIGFDAMRAAYRAIRPLKPAYGAQLSAAVMDAFLSQVPADLQEKVRAKLMTIIA